EGRIFSPRGCQGFHPGGPTEDQAMKPTFKRKRILVHPRFQFGLVARMSVYLLIATLAVLHTTFIMEVLVYVLSAPAKGAGKGINGLYGDFLLRQRPFLLTLVMIAPILLYDLFKFSHRIAGPLYRCRKVMQDMIDGKAAPEFKPRDRDMM